MYAPLWIVQVNGDCEDNPGITEDMLEYPMLFFERLQKNCLEDGSISLIDAFEDFPCGTLTKPITDYNLEIHWNQ